MSQIVAKRYTHTIKGRNYDKVYNRRKLKQQVKDDNDCQLETTDEWFEMWYNLYIDPLNILNRIYLEENL